jgi:hypothetical protein
VENVTLNADMEISIEPEPGLTMNLSEYLTDGAQLVDSSITGDLSDNIILGNLVGSYLSYSVTGNSAVGETGILTLDISSKNYGDYNITIPLKAVRKSTDVVFDASAIPENAGTTAVKCSNLSDFTDAQSEDVVQVVLNVKPTEEAAVDQNIINEFKNIAADYYEGVNSADVFQEYLDMKITKSVNGGAAEAIPDVQRVLEIEVSFDFTGKYNPIIIRDHEGTVMRFRKLDEKPTDNFVDGTFYCNGVDTIYIYTQFFSTYSVTYTTDSTFVPAPEPQNDTVKAAVLTTLPTVEEAVITSPKTGDANDHLAGVSLAMMLPGGFMIILARGKKKRQLSRLQV